MVSPFDEIYQKQMITVISQVSTTNFILEINKTPNDIKNEIIQRRSELTKKVKSEATRYNNPELLMDCSMLISMNDEWKKLPDTEEWKYYFSRRALEGYRENSDWFGFANAWSHCHWFLNKYDNEFSCECEYLILNNLDLFSKQDPYFSQELVENLTDVHATNRRIESSLFENKLDKVLIDIFERYVGLIEKFGENVKPEPPWIAVALKILHSSVQNTQDNPTELDLMDLHNLAINCFNQTSFEKNRKVLELYLEFGKLMDDVDSMYQYVSVLFAILSNSKPELLLDILVDTFAAIERDMAFWDEKPTMLEYIKEGTFDENKNFTEEDLKRLYQIRNS